VLAILASHEYVGDFVFITVPEKNDALSSSSPLGAFRWSQIADDLWTRTMSLVADLERLADGLGGDPAGAPSISWPTVAERIVKNLALKTDEVGILGLSARWRHLCFLVAEALRNVGYTPLTSKSALAAGTARESGPEFNNNFASVRQATVFEGVKTAGDSAAAIQKIISAPIPSGEKVIGVIQISRRGPDDKNLETDFTAADLGKVLGLCKSLANYSSTSPPNSCVHFPYIAPLFKQLRRVLGRLSSNDSPVLARSAGRKCVDTAKPSCYFSTAENFRRQTKITEGGTAHRHHGVRRKENISHQRRRKTS
jgi:hypothetical protein